MGLCLSIVSAYIWDFWNVREAALWILGTSLRMLNGRDWLSRHTAVRLIYDCSFFCKVLQ